MATECCLDWRGRSFDESGRVDGQSDALSWTIHVDDKTLTGTQVYAACRAGVTDPLPAWLDAHPADDKLTMRSLNLSQDAAAPTHWTAAARYSDRPLTEREEAIVSGSNNPIDWAPEIRVSSYAIPITTTTYRDALGVERMMLNSYGDPMTPVEDKIIGRRVDVSVNVSSAPSWVFDYEDSVNSDVIVIRNRVTDLTATVGQALMGPMTLGPVQTYREPPTPPDTTSTLTYYSTLSFSMLLRRDGWSLRRADEGTRARNNSGETVTFDELQFLDGTGKRLPQLINDDPLTENDIVFRQFDRKRFLSFGVLPLQSF